MKKFICIIIIICFSFSLKAQNNLANKKPTVYEKWELAKTISSRVIIRDTTRIGALLNQYDSTTMLNEYVDNTYERFIDPSPFYQLKNSIYKIAKSKNAIVYGYGGERLSQQEIKDRYCICDSVVVMDCFGAASGPECKMLVCDSTTRINGISAIDFHEIWLFNEKNKMIEKDVLAYTLLYYDFDKVLFMPLFMVFKDEQSVKTYWGEH